MYDRDLLIAYEEYCIEVYMCEGRTPVSLERWLDGEE